MPKLVATGLTKQEFSKHCADNDGIQSRLEDLDLQPRPKVISVSAAAAVEEEEEKNDPDEAPEEEELDYVDLTSRSWWHLVFRKAMKILCANRVVYMMWGSSCCLWLLRLLLLESHLHLLSFLD
jgi:hypothetical protein